MSHDTLQEPHVMLRCKKLTKHFLSLSDTMLEHLASRSFFTLPTSCSAACLISTCSDNLKQSRTRRSTLGCRTTTSCCCSHAPGCADASSSFSRACAALLLRVLAPDPSPLQTLLLQALAGHALPLPAWLSLARPQDHCRCCHLLSSERACSAASFSAACAAMRSMNSRLMA